MEDRGRWVLRPAVLVLVSGIAATAIFLRVWRLSWGLADGLFFPDESIWTRRVAALLGGSQRWFEPADRAPYPTLYGYLTALLTVTGNALGLTQSDRPVDVVLMARVVSAAAGIVTVALVALLGARMYSPRIGLAAAALMAVVPVEVVQVYYASVDALLTTFFTATVLASHALATRGTPGLAMLAGGCAGLAFATKYTGAAALTAAVAGTLAWCRSERTRRMLGLGLGVLAGFATATLVACPPCVLRPGTMLGGAARQQALMAAHAFVSNTLVPSLGWYGRPYLYQLVAALPYSLGWPLYALALVGVGVALRRREVADRVLLAALGPYFLFIAASATTFTRYLMPLFPGLVVLAARAALSMPWRRAGAVALGAAWLYTLALTASQVQEISYDQQREAARWIATHVQGRPVRVAFPQKLSGYFQLTPYLRREGLTPLPVASGQRFDAAPEVFVIPEWQATAIRRDLPEGPERRDLERLESGAAGYRRAASWSPWYLDRALYAWLDPGLNPGLGAYGFMVYVREPDVR